MFFAINFDKKSYGCHLNKNKKLLTFNFYKIKLFLNFYRYSLKMLYL